MENDNAVTESKAIEQVLERLKARYTEVEPAAVSAAVKAAEGRLRGARIRGFVPIFVERRARAELDASGKHAESSGPA
ncbi:hypothetical protein HUT05_05645 [Streptomyces chartreusis]|uniref:DUF3562 domain-containing protein n=2 Tax=Streptomyces chartreusis TaxID=1969 RepID=A0A7H8TNK7_STRCX|nr:hypothetical protein HUT05_05645 [Streptomyces chartreusis]